MVGVTIAESFAAKGQDVLLIFDNLTSHAKVYRQISLLLGRPAGREAYPGDIFYLHARLLERCGAFNAEAGGGSITAFPIVETQSDEVTDYITTNLMSITDGHILFRQNLANKGIQPAVDSGFSVSRIAGRAQVPAMRHLSDQLRQLVIQYNELERYMSFGTDIQKEAREVIDLGKRITLQFNQSHHETYMPHEQVLLLYLLVSKHVLYWDEEQMKLVRQQLLQFIQKPEWRSQVDLAMSMSNAEEALPIFENIIQAFRNDSETIRPLEKTGPSPAENETIIDLLRDSEGVANAVGKPQE
jgi:F-type H+-transporting ATPase subunit alpha